MSRNLRVATKDYLVNEIRIISKDEVFSANTFDSLETFRFPIIDNSVPIRNDNSNYNKIEPNDELDIQMVCCPPGTFKMGAKPGELGIRNNENQHVVTLTKSFLISKYEITQKQYEKVMGNNPSNNKGGPKYPVEKVNRGDALNFCEKLNTQYSRLVPYGYKFDLPTEAQWEYACRAGTTSALNSGKEITDSDRNNYPNINEVGWAFSNSGGRVHKVASVEKIPNKWGIYDMHGNVAEWCLDTRSTTYEDYSFTDPEVPLIDPIRLGGSNYMIRGGGYNSENKRLRSAARDAKGPGATDAFLGIRVVLVQTDD